MREPASAPSLQLQELCLHAGGSHDQRQPQVARFQIRQPRSAHTMCRSNKRAKLSHDRSVSTKKQEQGRSVSTKKQQSDDPFQSLPQDVLCLILSKLPLNEIVRTSTLSSKWRHTWTSCPNLIFDGATMCANSTTSSKEQRARVFIGSVNAVLKQCGATAVEEFQIKFPFDKLLVDHLNSWVKFAVSSRAKNLAIELEPEDLRCHKHRHVFRFPFELFDKQSMSRLEAIRLSLVSLKAQPNFSGFPSLKALHLSSVDVSSNDLQLVLSSCSNLERLSIFMCHPHDDIKSKSATRTRGNELSFVNTRACHYRTSPSDAPCTEPESECMHDIKGDLLARGCDQVFSCEVSTAEIVFLWSGKSPLLGFFSQSCPSTRRVRYTFSAPLLSAE
ncbi:hypothetical protein VPH35_128283 [Triticum aestivum]